METFLFQVSGAEKRCAGEDWGSFSCFIVSTISETTQSQIEIAWLRRDWGTSQDLTRRAFLNNNTVFLGWAVAGPPYLKATAESHK